MASIVLPCLTQGYTVATARIMFLVSLLILKLLVTKLGERIRINEHGTTKMLSSVKLSLVPVLGPTSNCDSLTKGGNWFWQQHMVKKGEEVTQVIAAAGGPPYPEQLFARLQ